MKVMKLGREGEQNAKILAASSSSSSQTLERSLDGWRGRCMKGGAAKRLWRR